MHPVDIPVQHECRPVLKPFLFLSFLPLFLPQSLDINSVFPYSITVGGELSASSAMVLVAAGNKVAVLRARDGSLVQEEVGVHVPYATSARSCERF